MPRKLGYFRTLAAAALGRLGLKASVVGPMISRLMLGRPVWPERDYKALAKEGYQQNSVVYACVSLIARSVADIPWVMYSGRGDNREEIEEHPLFDLMDRPNPLQDRVQFLTAFISYHLITGNAFIERTDERKLERMELYAHRPDRMKVIPGPTGVPSAYEYTVNGAPRRFEVDLDAGEMPILHLKRFNPLDDWYGQSPLDAAAWAIDLYNGGSAYDKAILDNAGAPAGALVYEGTGSDTSALHSPEDYEAKLRILRGEDRRFGKGGDRMLLEGGKHSWLQFGLEPEKMQFIEGMHRAAREIAFALGVPPELVGLPGDKTYSNYQEARLSFYQETVIPLAQEIARAFTHWFAPVLGKGIRIEPNLDKIDALTSVRLDHWERIEKSSVLSLNEKREELGFEPVDGGDEHYVSAGQIPVNTPQITGQSADGNLPAGPPGGGTQKPNGGAPPGKGKKRVPHYSVVH